MGEKEKGGKERNKHAPLAEQHLITLPFKEHTDSELVREGGKRKKKKRGKGGDSSGANRRSLSSYSGGKPGSD